MVPQNDQIIYRKLNYSGHYRVLSIFPFIPVYISLYTIYQFIYSTCFYTVYISLYILQFIYCIYKFVCISYIKVYLHIYYFIYSISVYLHYLSVYTFIYSINIYTQYLFTCMSMCNLLLYSISVDAHYVNTVDISLLTVYTSVSQFISLDIISVYYASLSGCVQCGVTALTRADVGLFQQQRETLDPVKRVEVMNPLMKSIHAILVLWVMQRKALS